MLNYPKVSIVVPVYKKEHSIKRCIESLINQDYKNIELIFIDDGSPDRCGYIIDETVEHCSFAKVIHQKNSGVSVARNEGTKYAKGEYICYVDADDYLLKDYISTLVKEMENDVDMVVSSTERDCRQEKYYATRTGAIKKMFIDDTFNVCVWGKLFKKNLIPQNVFPKGIKMGEDMFALCRIINKCAKIKFIPYNGYLYTKDATEGSFVQCDLHDYLKVTYLIDDMKDYVGKIDKEIIKYFEIGKVRRYLGLLNIMEKKNSIVESYSGKCLSEIKIFRKTYGYCSELSLYVNLRIFLATYFPKAYLKIVRRMMKR